jgi:hypothetical protein
MAPSIPFATRVALIAAAAGALGAMAAGAITSAPGKAGPGTVRQPSEASQIGDSSRSVARALALVRANGNSLALKVTSYQRHGSRIVIDFAPVGDRMFGGAVTVQISTGTICVHQFE